MASGPPAPGSRGGLCVSCAGFPRRVARRVCGRAALRRATALGRGAHHAALDGVPLLDRGGGGGGGLKGAEAEASRLGSDPVLKGRGLDDKEERSARALAPSLAFITLDSITSPNWLKYSRKSSVGRICVRCKKRTSFLLPVFTDKKHNSPSVVSHERFPIKILCASFSCPLLTISGRTSIKQ